MVITLVVSVYYYALVVIHPNYLVYTTMLKPRWWVNAHHYVSYLKGSVFHFSIFICLAVPAVIWHSCATVRISTC